MMDAEGGIGEIIDWRQLETRLMQIRILGGESAVIGRGKRCTICEESRLAKEEPNSMLR